MKIPEKTSYLCLEYRKKFNKKPNPFNYDEYDSFEEYNKYLEKELEKDKI